MSDPLEWDDPPVFNALPAVDNLPLASFPTPVVAPDVDPDDCENGDTICVRYRAEWYPLVAGALSQLLQPSTWDGTYDERILALNRAEMLKNMLRGGQEDVGNCGCPQIIYRWSENGTLLQSSDGGTTWEASTYGDPRVSGTVFPPLTGTDGATKRCQAADNLVANFEAQIVEYVESLNNDARSAELVLVIAGNVALLIGVFAPYTLAVIALGAALVSAGAAFVEDAFDPDVWDRLRCNIYCNMSADGSFSAANIADIKSQVYDDETGLVAALIVQMIDTLGVVGMTNGGRVGSGAGTDCDDCGCDCEEPTSFTHYIANEANDAYTIGVYRLDGSCDGRSFGNGQPTNNVRLIIPDRGTRTVMAIQPAYCDSAGIPLDVDVKVGIYSADEGTQEAHGAPIYTFNPPIDNDQVDVSMPTPSQGWLLLHHITVYYCGEEE